MVLEQAIKILICSIPLGVVKCAKNVFVLKKTRRYALAIKRMSMQMTINSFLLYK
jgi:hypothetical protein